MKTDAYRDGRLVQHRGHLGRGEPFPLDQQQELSIMRVERSERVLDSAAPGITIDPDRRRLITQPFAQPATALVRTCLVGEHTPRRRVQPRPGVISGRHILEAPPRDEKHLGDRIFRIGERAGTPTAIRGDPGQMPLEERVKRLVALSARHDRVIDALLISPAHVHTTTHRYIFV